MIPLLAAMAKSTRQQLYQVLLAQVLTCCLFDPIALNRVVKRTFSTNAAVT